MGKILDRLKHSDVLVSDGAWGTFLHQKGLSADESPESWNLSRPDDVFAIATSYVDAGADIILTNSFGGSPFKLEAYGLRDQVYEINRTAAEISRRAAGDRVLVLGSIGPTGKMVFMGEVEEDQLLDGFKEQANGLKDGGADGILIETMSDTQEALIAIQAAKNVTDLDVLCTFTFERTQAGEYRTMMGTTVTEALESSKTAGADIFGANCGNGIAGMVEIVKEVRKTDRDVPILVHANAGLPIYKDGKTIFPETPAEMASQTKALIEAGVNIFGGCCGTTPEHIRVISQIVKPK